MSLKLAGSTFSYLHHRPLSAALDDLASQGLSSFELTPMSPHVNIAGFGAFERRALKRQMDRLGLECTSVNPAYVDLNIASTNAEFRELSLRQLEQCADVAHDLSAACVVVIGGRQHALQPAPRDDTIAVASAGLDRLVTRADPLGVTIALENSPYGFLASATDLMTVAGQIEGLGICYDAANALTQEDPAAGLRLVAERLSIAHVSDTTHDQWQHNNVGSGEVDFAGFAATLQEIGWRGATVYELVNGRDPGARLKEDVQQFTKWGWEP
jgi:sugar phosphate isomerase/epimerase